MCHVMLYNMCHVTLYNMCHVMLYNMCHVMLYNMCHVMLYKAEVALWPSFFMSRHMLSHKYVTTFTPREFWRSHVWDINDI